MSGNAAGKPPMAMEVRDAFRGRSLTALKVLDDAMRGDDRTLAVRAAEVVLARAWGRPPLMDDPEISASITVLHPSPTQLAADAARILADGTEGPQ